MNTLIALLDTAKYYEYANCVFIPDRLVHRGGSNL